MFSLIDLFVLHYKNAPEPLKPDKQFQEEDSLREAEAVPGPLNRKKIVLNDQLISQLSGQLLPIQNKIR
jgi:hypothetical protein